MKRTTMFLDPELERDVRRYAERQGRSTASVVREALAQWVEAQRAVPAARPAFVASARSGRSDTAEGHESLVFAGLDPHTGVRAGAARAGGRATPSGRRRTPRTPVR
jgi:predicted transcriptional regulator